MLRRLLIAGATCLALGAVVMNAQTKPVPRPPAQAPGQPPPDESFATNRTLYLTYTALPEGANPAALPRAAGLLMVASAKLSADDRRLEGLKVLLNAEGIGGRLIQANDGTLFISSSIPAGLG